MKTLRLRIDQLEQKNNYAFYLAFFRIFLCVLLLRNIIVSWKYVNVLYRGTSFFEPDTSALLNMLSVNEAWLRNGINYFLLAYIVFIILYFFGIGKHATALMVFFLFEINQRLCYVTLNGGDNLLKFIVLYMVFADSYQYFSIKPLQFKRNSWRELSNLTTNLAGLSVCLHLCLVYFISAFHKVHADVWFNGIATYYTLSLERFRGTPLNLMLAKNGLFVTISTYMTVMTEMFFPVLVWFRQTRRVVIVAAAFLHAGIFVFMMLYDFQLTFLATLGFFITEKEWETIRTRISGITQRITSRFKRLPAINAKEKIEKIKSEING